MNNFRCVVDVELGGGRKVVSAQQFTVKVYVTWELLKKLTSQKSTLLGASSSSPSVAASVVGAREFTNALNRIIFGRDCNIVAPGDVIKVADSASVQQLFQLELITDRKDCAILKLYASNEFSRVAEQVLNFIVTRYPSTKSPRHAPSGSTDTRQEVIRNMFRFPTVVVVDCNFSDVLSKDDALAGLASFVYEESEHQVLIGECRDDHLSGVVE